MSTQHERDSETGFDYRGARFYDAECGRFLSLDPLAMDYPSLSDYNYVAGNPIIFIDPTGLAPEGWSKDNIELTERFGVFGNGGSGYNDLFGSSEPPTLDQVLDKGSQSKTFEQLMKTVGITKENASSIITIGRHTHIIPGTGKISIKKGNLDFMVMALTHEMTNTTLANIVADAQENVSEGRISPEDYARAALKVETEGILNQVIVAAEANVDFPMARGAVNNLRAGSITPDDIRVEISSKLMQITAMDDGSNLFQRYVRSAKILRRNRYRKDVIRPNLPKGRLFK